MTSVPPSPASAAVFDRSSRWLGVSRDDGALVVVDTGDRDLARREIALHRGTSLRLLANPHGSGFVSGGSDGRLLAVDPAGEILALAARPHRFIDQVAASSRGHLVWANDHDLTIIGPDEAQNILLPEAPSSLAVSVDARLVVTARAGRIEIRDADKAGVLLRSILFRGAPVKVALSPCKRLVAASLYGGGIGLWRVETGRGGLALTLPAPAVEIAWARDIAGDPVLLGASGDRLFALSPRQPQEPRWFGPGNGRRITAFAFSAEGAVIAIGTEDGEILRYSAWNYGLLEQARPAGGIVAGLAFSAGGYRLGIGYDHGAIAQLAPDSADWVI
ncbi:WD40 repeat domain-containing protein [Zavarzinia compransoris]|uniref:Anaphase-promoting complex subunit 4 WD40 domain-containing protein n=1 Tax=Zavarzinia compransoris TaxID=1264899 RepID=A0A317DYC4_9PROT|nr:WD40 repeat domain-containing protein [Zavarzinia compransoris]PWR17993.1 hypothetical protein DKG75_20850 [Zavarzinia compransoris]TDP43545.1 hypothetical protein DES42_111113 [Zavarzinia compransoris]